MTHSVSLLCTAIMQFPHQLSLMLPIYSNAIISYYLSFFLNMSQHSHYCLFKLCFVHRPCSLAAHGEWSDSGQTLPSLHLIYHACESHSLDICMAWSPYLWPRQPACVKVKFDEKSHTMGMSKVIVLWGPFKLLWHNGINRMCI